MAAIGRFFFFYRNALFPFAILLALLPGPHLFANPLIAPALGLLIALLGQLVRAATIGLAYIVRGGRAGRVYAEDLVTEGIYSHTRNPMYVGNVLIATGVALAANTVTALAVAIVLFVFVYQAIIAAEEEFLLNKFGAGYQAYCRAVPRWLPSLSGLAQTLGAMQFRWRRMLVKEYGTPFGWISFFYLIMLYGFWRDGILEEHRALASTCGMVLLALAICWMSVMYLKKSGRLVAD